MSKLIVEICKINDIQPHNNAQYLFAKGVTDSEDE